MPKKRPTRAELQALLDRSKRVRAELSGLLVAVAHAYPLQDPAVRSLERAIKAAADAGWKLESHLDDPEST